MRDARRIISIVTVALLAVGLGLAITAVAGAGQATVAKKKKRCPAGTHKVVIKKHGKKRRKCVPNTGAGTTTARLSINPTSHDYGGTQHRHGGAPANCPGQDCKEFTYTVTNTGVAASGVPVVAVNVVHDPNGTPNQVAFAIISNTCTAALAPGASCVIDVGFVPNQQGPGTYTSTLGVSASPGGTVQATMTGVASS